MPRGIGRHFCSLNSVNAFSASFVELYDNLENLNEEAKFNLWLFLNSSIAWLIREISGRKNLGGGMLKAEAIDLKAFPLYYEFDQFSSIKKIFSKLKDREALHTLDEIRTTEHAQIDDIVYGYLGINRNLREVLKSLLVKKITERSEKSKTS